ncbi:MAG: hypothetical protein RMJ31_05180 [Nitrososphaerota archaeon]|nr:hypothetical protein [Nitrososphaerales archaeon]MDW8045149.1 hypothetical protein [Nitrososphaerota archaeon]
MVREYFEQSDIERQRFAIRTLRDYLITLVATQALGILLILLWLKTDPSKTEILIVFFISALILAIFWPITLAFIFSCLRKKGLKFLRIR